jgi:flagellar hook-basal body complex protein FliE
VDVKGIDRIAPQIADTARPGAGKAGGGPSFGEVLRTSLAEVNRLQAQADEEIRALATGEGATLHDTMIALEKADLSFRLMMQVRNKIVEAYQEILRMQV